MRLYALKHENRYLRTGPGGSFTGTGLEKASVFSPEQLPVLREHLAQAEKSGYPGTHIVVLEVRETGALEGQGETAVCEKDQEAAEEQNKLCSLAHLNLDPDGV